MAEPVPANAVAARIRAEIDPMVRDWPEANRTLLLRYIEAWTAPLLPVEEVVRDDPETGIIGWGKVLHPDTAPEAWLDWLSMFPGTVLKPGDTAEVKRDRIRAMEGLRRGSIAAVDSAVRATLSDPNSPIYINERAGSAWRSTVATLANATPDPERTRLAMLSQKPAGLVVTYITLPDTAVPGTADNSYTTLKFTHSDYEDISNTFVSYDEMKTDSDKQ